MGRSIGSSVPVLLVLVALFGCRALGRPTDEQQSADNEMITFQREQIVVEFEDHVLLSLMMDPNDTVRDLYEDIIDYEGLPGRRIWLRFGDDKLRNYDARLRDRNIRAGTTVKLGIFEDFYRETVEFIVKTLDNQELPMVAVLGETVASLKDNITQRTGIQQTQPLRLLLNGKELKDEYKLVQYGIDYGPVVHLGRPLEDFNATATILVKTLSGATLEVEANLAGTVADLKEKIAEKSGVPAGVQRLSINLRSIGGNDRLCDHGLEAGSIVYMFLYSPRITSPDQVAQLQDGAPHRAPIFREMEDVQGSRAILRDTRNWIARGRPRPGWNPGRFNPVAYLDPNPDDERSMEFYERALGHLLSPDLEICRAKIKLSATVRAYRVAAKITTKSLPGQEPGISLGGGMAAASTGRKKPVPLGADINNYAPDAFSDSDLMRLFEMSERVRQVLTRAEQTGEGILSIASQRRINEVILTTYLEALAGYPRSVEFEQTSEGQECGICRDDLRAEPAVKLGCEHTFHADCILHWVTDLYRKNRYPCCPYCRQRFMFAYEALGKAELATEPELHDNEKDN